MQVKFTCGMLGQDANAWKNLLPGQPLGESPSLESVADRRGSLCVYRGVMKKALLERASDQPDVMSYSNLSGRSAEQLF